MYIIQALYSLTNECQQYKHYSMIEKDNLVCIQPTGLAITNLTSYKLRNIFYCRQLDAIGDGTFITREGSVIKHINSEGKRILQHKGINVLQFVLLNQYQVLIVSHKHRIVLLSVWNIRNKHIFHIQHPFTFSQDRLSLQIFIFKNTQLLCLCQRLPSLQQKQTLLYQFTYFKLPLLEAARPVHRYKYSVSFLQHSDAKVVKLNQYSMLGIISNKYLPHQHISIQTYNIDEDRQICKQTQQQINKKKGIILDHSFSQWFSQNVQSTHFVISDILQVKPLLFYIQCRLSLREQIWQEKSSQLHIRYPKEHFYSFYWSYPEQQIKASKLNIQSQHLLQFVDNIRTLNTIRVRQIKNMTKKAQKGQFSWQTIYRTYEQISKRQQNIPVYYVKPESEQIVCAHPYKNKTIQHIVWSAQSYTVFDYEIDSKQNCVSVHLKKMPDQWCLYWINSHTLCTFLSLQTIKDCDEDLLRSICDLVPIQYYQFQQQ